ncbi:MAG: hypothetical protein M3R38_07880 [Actinomycetota bacterium]|nr:hypothetical protein [Actinomycetota bacterium]
MRTFADLGEALLDVVRARSRLHGWRIQALFEAVAASLGRVRLLKTEDAGDVYYAGASIKPPDFRVVTSDGEQVLIEVKSFHPKRPDDPFTMRRKDVDELVGYAALTGVATVKVAVYWSAWNLWTLTDVSALGAHEPRRVGIALPDAMKANEMVIVGDRLIGTEWPLALTLYADTSKPRGVDAEGEAVFTIGAAKYSVAGRTITRGEEQQIAHRLMLYGRWTEETPVEMADGDIVSVSFSFAPEQPPPQPPALHGALSSIYSSMFNHATLDDEGEITELRMDVDPGALGSLIPDDYEGETLRIWRFQLRPP